MELLLGIFFLAMALDTLSGYGDYEACGNDPFEITYGHSKDHRPDLKQFLISMLCVDRNIPVFGKIEDGNASDKSVNNDVLSEISKYMAAHGLGAGAFIYIADSAAITKKNLKNMGQDILFISRLPATFNGCQSAFKFDPLSASKNDPPKGKKIILSPPLNFCLATK